MSWRGEQNGRSWLGPVTDYVPADQAVASLSTSSRVLMAVNEIITFLAFEGTAVVDKGRGQLVLAGDRLVAVLMRLTDAGHGSEREHWFLEPASAPAASPFRPLSRTSEQRRDGSAVGSTTTARRHSTYPTIGPSASSGKEEQPQVRRTRTLFPA